MKPHPALASLEFNDIAVGVIATDAMLKKAPIAFFRSGTITRGRYLTLLGGTTASVEEALEEGRRQANGSLLDSVLLPDVHPLVYAAVLGERRAGRGALAIVETTTVGATLRGAEAALKGTPVGLLELRLADSGLAGKGLAFYQGELHDVEAAVLLAVEQAQAVSVGISFRVIPAPHEALIGAIGATTAFSAARLVELEGERL